MPRLTDSRTVLSLSVSAVAGTVGLHAYPFPADQAVLTLVHLKRPILYAGFTYTYAALWFSSAFFLASIACSCFYIFVGRHVRPTTLGPLPAYPAPEQREDLFVVLGECHHRTAPTRAERPTWLAIPERGLYTGILVVSAIGSGKTSACMYPYVDQLLAYRATDPARKAAGLVLEVKGDFCRQVPDILRRHGREDDYVEVSLDSPYRYNPLHNDLDAYALAYGIATLMTNLFGRGKEPFWQQASTNLVKFVILLHQVLDDYVTLFRSTNTSSTPTSCGLGLRTGSGTSARTTAASSSTNGSTSSRRCSKAGRGTTTRPGLGRGRNGPPISRRRSDRPASAGRSSMRRRPHGGPTRWRNSRPSSGGSRMTRRGSSPSSAHPSSKGSVSFSRCSTTIRASSTPSARRRTRTIPRATRAASLGRPCRRSPS